MDLHLNLKAELLSRMSDGYLVTKSDRWISSLKKKPNANVGANKHD